MFLIAVSNLITLSGHDTDRAGRWNRIASRTRENVRSHLWDKEREKFRPHIYLEGSPFPADFDEDEIYYHGGTAVAIEAGLLSREEIATALEMMADNVRRSGAPTIGLTLYPPYPAGYFKNQSMATPYSYQNGGDWTWFGGRMIQQLILNGFIEEAYREIGPMVERVIENEGFFEWYTKDNIPTGSGTFRGSAGVLGHAIQMLQEWPERLAALERLTGDKEKQVSAAAREALTQLR